MLLMYKNDISFCAGRTAAKVVSITFYQFYPLEGVK